MKMRHIVLIFSILMVGCYFFIEYYNDGNTYIAGNMVDINEKCKQMEHALKNGDDRNQLERTLGLIKS